MNTDPKLIGTFDKDGFSKILPPPSWLTKEALKNQEINALYQRAISMAEDYVTRGQRWRSQKKELEYGVIWRKIQVACWNLGKPKKRETIIRDVVPFRKGATHEGFLIRMRWKRPHPDWRKPADYSGMSGGTTPLFDFRDQAEDAAANIRKMNGSKLDVRVVRATLTLEE